MIPALAARLRLAWPSSFLLLGPSDEVRGPGGARLVAAPGRRPPAAGPAAGVGKPPGRTMVVVVHRLDRLPRVAGCG